MRRARSRPFAPKRTPRKRARRRRERTVDGSCDLDGRAEAWGGGRGRWRAKPAARELTNAEDVHGSSGWAPSLSRRDVDPNACRTFADPSEHSPSELRPVPRIGHEFAVTRVACDHADERVTKL